MPILPQHVGNFSIDHTVSKQQLPVGCVDHLRKSTKLLFNKADVVDLSDVESIDKFHGVEGGEGFVLPVFNGLPSFDA